MPRHTSRGLRGLVPSFLRSLSVSSLALGGLIASLPAQAAEQEPSVPPTAAIIDVNLEDGALTARILWSKKANPEETLTLVSLDRKDGASDEVEVRPKPGAETEVKLYDAAKSPWDTGWARKLVLRNNEGKAVATQPYDLNLACEAEDKCVLVATPGGASAEGVIHMSQDLDEAITLLKEKAGDAPFDLVEQVSKTFPELRGEAYVYAHQAAQLKGTAGPCECAWQMVKTRNPNSGQSLAGTAHLSSRGGTSGEGAKHWMDAYAQGKFLSRVHGIDGVTEGNSNLTLKLNCSQLIRIEDKWVTIINPDGTFSAMHIVLPIYGACTSPCQARFDHLGRITGKTSINGDNRPGNRAVAEETGRYSVDGSYLLNHTVTANGNFDNTATRTVYGYGSTGRVESRGYLWVVGRWESASASVKGGNAMAIHATAACMNDPFKEVAVWDFGTAISPEHETSLKDTIRNFFLQWHIPVNP